MILIIGATSRVGSALIDELVALGEPVRALTRAPQRPSGLPPAVGWVRGDLADRGSIEAALRGVDRLFLLSSPHPLALELHRNAIDAAAAARVTLVVRQSMLNADAVSPYELERQHGEAEAYLFDSGLPCVMLRPHQLSQSVLDLVLPGVVEAGELAAISTQSRTCPVDARDVAAVAASVLHNPGPLGADVLDITGPQALSMVDIATLLGRALGHAVRCTEIADALYRSALVARGHEQWLARAMVDLQRSIRESGTDGWAAITNDTVERFTGRAPRRFEAVVAERVPVG